VVGSCIAMECEWCRADVGCSGGEASHHEVPLAVIGRLCVHWMCGWIECVGEGASQWQPL
jgi:hypothetical protein